MEVMMTQERGVRRILKPNGIFISIAFGQPHFRRPLFNAPEFTWSIDSSTFGDGFHYFFCILRKILESDTFHVLSLGSSVGLKPSLEYMSIELAGVDRPGLLS
nr:methyltransferase-like protein 13 [Tanacetum cinerariifolium]